jgi:dUTP pyrophosphatase
MRIKRLTDTAIAPTYATDGSAGLDLYADEDCILDSVYDGGRKVISTGISVEIDADKVGLIWPRSGIAVKNGIDTGAGVIDSDYRGGVKVLLFNHGEYAYKIKRGDRIAQLLIVPCYRPNIVAVDNLDETERGEAGFGSSGK